MNRKLIAPLLILGMVLLSCQVTGGKNAEPPTVPPVPTIAMPTIQAPTAAPPTEMPTQPIPTQPVPTQPLPTQPLPTLETKDGPYLESFDSDLDENWYTWTRPGNPDKKYVSVTNGRLRFEMPSTETYTYVENEGPVFTDVIVTAKFETVKSMQNGIAVICRSSDAGWYEMRVFTRGDTAGRMSVFRYDPLMRDQGRNPYINIMGGFDTIATEALINGDNKTNIISMACVGSELTFYINGKQVVKADRKPFVVKDTSLEEGWTGVGVMSFEKGTVVVEFDDLAADVP